MTKQHTRRGRAAKQRRRATALTNLRHAHEQLAAKIAKLQAATASGTASNAQTLTAVIAQFATGTASGTASGTTSAILAQMQRRASIMHRQIKTLERRIG